MAHNGPFFCVHGCDPPPPTNPDTPQAGSLAAGAGRPTHGLGDETPGSTTSGPDLDRRTVAGFDDLAMGRAKWILLRSGLWQTAVVLHADV